MDLQTLYIGIGTCLFLTLIILLMPSKYAVILGNKFSFGKKGMHFSRFYRDNRDLLGNFLLLIGIIYSFGFGFIPEEFEKYTFTALYAIFSLLVINQYYRVYGQKRIVDRLPSISALCTMASVNYISAAGYLNNFGLAHPSAEFAKSLLNERIYHLTYFLAYNHFICYLLNIFLYCFSFYCLLAQFKYLRLEDNVKAKNAIFLWIKVIIISALMLGLSYHGYQFILLIFNIG